MATPRMKLRHDIAALTLAPFLARLLARRNSLGAAGPYEYRIKLARPDGREPRFDVSVHNAQGDRRHHVQSRSLSAALEKIADDLAVVEDPSPGFQRPRKKKEAKPLTA